MAKIGQAQNTTAQNGLAKVGQIRMAKTGLAKVGKSVPSVQGFSGGVQGSDLLRPSPTQARPIQAKQIWIISIIIVILNIITKILIWPGLNRPGLVEITMLQLQLKSHLVVLGLADKS